ncbi:hypothetical protein MIR68_008951 [Amoeboaphelidium protococcarum]|nr:hypothetical protein MIR68_008951 [Amoeboaphelidium protococcarum]
MTKLMLSLDEAAKDSPLFRATLSKIEDDIEQVAQWLDSCIRAGRGFNEELIKFNSMATLLAHRLHLAHRGQSSQSQEQLSPNDGARRQQFIDSQVTTKMLDTFSESLQCISPFSQKLIDEVEELLISPLVALLKYELAHLKEKRRNYERIVDKYEYQVGKYVGISRQKEPSAIREDSFQLYDVRKSYIAATLDYTCAIVKFKRKLDVVLYESIDQLYEQFTEFYSNCQQIYDGFKPRISEIKQVYERNKEQLDEYSADYESTTPLMIQQLIAKAKPSSALPINTIPEKPAVTEQSLTHKAGYLYKKYGARTAIGVAQWNRKWVIVQNGKLLFHTMVNRSTIGVSYSLPLSLVEVRIDDKSDRRFVFELLTNKKSYYFQAETEQDLLTWVECIEAAKLYSMDRDNMDSVRLDDEKMLDDDEYEETLNVEITASVQDVTSASDQSGVLMPSTQQPLLLSAKVVHFVKYPNAAMRKKNQEFHYAVKAVGSDEYVMEAFTSAFCPKNSSECIPGKLYLTQKSICFVSSASASGSIILLLPLSQVKSVHKSDYNGTSSLYYSVSQLSQMVDSQEYEVVNVDHIVQVPFESDKAFGASQLLINNVQNQERSAQSLFDEIYAKYRSSPAEQIQQLQQQQQQQQKIQQQQQLQQQVKLPTDEQGGVQTTYKWPEDAPAQPQDEVKCGCESHFEREEHNLELDVPAHVLFAQLFEQKLIFEQVHQLRNDWDVTISDWAVNDGSNSDGSGDQQQKSRTVRWMFNVNNPMVSLKTTDCIEVQTVTSERKYLCYVVDCFSKTVKVPYGDAFQTQTRYCITYIDASKCRLRITIGVEWFKNPMVKSIIKSQAMKGLTDYLKDLVKIIQTQVVKSPDGKSLGPGLDSKSAKAVPSQSGVAQKSTLGVNDLSVSSIISTLLDITSYFTVQTIAAVLFTLVVMLTLQFFLSKSPVQQSSSHQSYGDHHNHHHQQQYQQQPIALQYDSISQDVVGIYLRDIQDSLLNSNSTLGMGNGNRAMLKRASFQAFLSSDNHRWFKVESRKQHRAKLQMLKHLRMYRKHLLDSFRQINQMEYELLTAQYALWMKDQILHCQSLLDKVDVKHRNKLQNACKALQVDLRLLQIYQ